MTRRHLLYPFVGICVGVLVIGIIYTSITTASTSTAIRATQLDNTQRAKDTKAAAIAAKHAAQRIEDCTTPGRPCYEDAQKRTAKAVGDINRVVILAAACSVGLDPNTTVLARQDQIQACVIRRLAATP